MAFGQTEVIAFNFRGCPGCGDESNSEWVVWCYDVTSRDARFQGLFIIGTGVSTSIEPHLSICETIESSLMLVSSASRRALLRMMLIVASPSNGSGKGS